MDTEKIPDKQKETIVCELYQQKKEPAHNVYCEYCEEWKEFNDKIKELLHPESDDGIAVFVFIRQRLWQFHLNGSYDIAYVVNEAYIRAHKLIHSGKDPIKSLPAWLKQTALNVIRELSRQEHRYLPLEEERWVECEEQPPISNEDLRDEPPIGLAHAFRQLTPAEQDLLNWKIVADLPWKEVLRLYRDRYDTDCTEVALRKKKERALRKLRQIYLELEKSEM